MSRSRWPPLRGVSVLPIGGGLADGIAVVASQEVRALAAEWVTTSRAYFEALEDWEAVPVDSPNRPVADAAVDVATLADEAVRRRIIAVHSTEPGAMALKVAVALAQMRDRGGADAVIADRSQLEGPCEEALALALVRDMAVAFGPTVEVLARAGRRPCRS